MGGECVSHYTTEPPVVSGSKNIKLNHEDIGDLATQNLVCK